MTNSDDGITRVQQLFLDTLEIPEEQRDSWLIKQCGGDQNLLDNVRSLLKHDAPENDPLEKRLNEVISDLSSIGISSEVKEKQNPDTDHSVVADCDLFLDKLSEVGVLSDEEFSSVSKAIASETSPSDPRQLASKLVSDGKLTQYQASALLRGQPELLIDKYLILDLIDVGGMGMVFKAVHRTMNRIVAIKMITQGMLSSPEQVKRFQREVRVAATLEHSNIVRSYDADQSRGIHFLVMEYVRGDNLNKTVKQKGPLSLEQATDCILQAAHGLHYAHQQGIVHRDIKPGNLMLTEDGVVKLLDLGLANVDDSLRVLHQASVAEEKESGRPHVSGVELTASGTVLGTVSYMAPEQSLDSRLADARSDIYSLGCTLYFLLTGEAPYLGDTIFKIFLQHRNNQIPWIRDKRPDVPQAIEAICHKMLAKKPDDRYQSMSELITAIKLCEISRPGKTTQPENDFSVPLAPTAPTVVEEHSRSLSYRLSWYKKVAIIVSSVGIAILLGFYSIFSFLNQQNPPVEPPPHPPLPPPEVHPLVLKDLPRTPLPDGPSGEVKQLKGHTGIIRGVAFSPNGRIIASSSSDNTVRLWDVETGKVLHILKGHTDSVGMIKFSSTGTMLASCSNDSTAIIWDVNSGRELYKLTEFNKQKVMDVAFSPDDLQLATATLGKVVNVWDFKTGKLIHALKGHSEFIIAVSYSPDGKLIASVSGDRSTKIWDTKTGQKIRSLEEKSGFVQAVEFSSDSKTLGSVGGLLDRTFRIWDVETGKELSHFKIHKSIRCMAFLPDSQHVLLGGEDKNLRVVNVKSGAEIHRFTATNHATNFVSTSPDGRFAVTGGGGYTKFMEQKYIIDGDFTLRIWRLPKAVCPKQPAIKSVKPVPAVLRMSDV